MSTEFPVALRGTKASTLMWAHEYAVDPQALTQIRMMADLPWVEGIRIMPDVHPGVGATVGSVIAMRDAVAPHAVGVDIGCGMIAVHTSLTASDLPDDLGRLRRRIEDAVPTGHHVHRGPVDIRKLPVPAGTHRDHRRRGLAHLWEGFDGLHHGVMGLRSRAQRQLGTLGGGNHFIELCVDQDDDVWLQLHSGSRGIGKALAQRHIDIASGLAHNQGLADRDLAVFLAGTAPMESYLRDLRWAQSYASWSREVMMALVCDVVATEFADRDLRFARTVNVHHNYVATERVGDTDLIVTRKGAIRAGRGDLGLIPGSMGTGSYVVRGLGNPESYWSASHGAGRRLSRGQAKEQFTLDDLAAQTRGVECRKDAGVLDEIPGAYKDLDAVIAAQRDLVEVVARLDTLLCVKG